LWRSDEIQFKVPAEDYQPIIFDFQYDATAGPNPVQWIAGSCSKREIVVQAVVPNCPATLLVRGMDSLLSPLTENLMPRDGSQFFPRDFPDRVVLGTGSSALGAASVVCAWMCFFHTRPKLLGERIFVAASGELLVALSLFFVVGLIWAVATPRWLERFLSLVFGHLVISFLVFLVPFGVALICGLANT